MLSTSACLRKRGPPRPHSLGPVTVGISTWHMVREQLSATTENRDREVSFYHRLPVQGAEIASWHLCEDSATCRVR